MAKLCSGHYCGKYKISVPPEFRIRSLPAEHMLQTSRKNNLPMFDALTRILIGNRPLISEGSG